MRIGINALPAENLSGTGRYTTELLRALAKWDSENRYEVLARADSPLVETLSGHPNFRVHPLAKGGAFRRYLFERGRLRGWILEHNLDVFHGPAFVIPPKCPVPAVVTIHDLVFHLFPETTPLSRRRHYRSAISRSIREARLILADSISTARDLERHFDVAPDRIRPVPLGVEARFFREPGSQARLEARRRYGLPDRFLLCVGTLEPRKNLPALLQGYARLLEIQPRAPSLVLIGRTGWGVGNLAALIGRLGLAERVHLPGFVRDEDLPALYRLADLFVFTSRYEGFGLPVLEAMACGTPVVAPGHSSIPELVGDTAFLIGQKHNEIAEEIARVMQTALSDTEACRVRSVAARERARGFSWEAAAEKTLAAYAEIVGESA